MSVETRPMKSMPWWPINHINANTARSTTLLNAPGKGMSHWITGYTLQGLAAADGFSFLRRSCLKFNTTDTWTAADGGALLDTGTEAASGHMTIEMWVYIPTATGAHATLLKRGDEAADGWLLEITSAGAVKFTIHDSAAAATVTGTRSIFDRWAFIAVVFERNSATGLKIYVDGEADTIAAGSQNTTALNLTCDGGTTVVSTGVANKTNYLGPIGLYIGASAALSAATILSNYNEGYGRKYHGAETGLSLAWNNDEGTGTLCYDVKGNDGYKSTVSGTDWVPYKQIGGTAADLVMGPPFGTLAEKNHDPTDMLAVMGPYITGELVAGGALTPVAWTFPSAVKIGHMNPLRILETDGAFSMTIFGFTDGV
jgi:hypothetical protein